MSKVVLTDKEYELLTDLYNNANWIYKELPSEIRIAFIAKLFSKR